MSRPNRRALRLETLLDRCMVDGDCWIWQGYYAGKSGIPAGYLHNRRVSVRRAVLELQGKPLPGPGEIAVCRHGERGCVNPAHILVISRADMLAQLRATGAINETRRVQSIAAAVRRRPGLVLDMETARALRADDRSALAIERATGINHETVSKVRRGKLWRELVASPWAGMGGRP